jgi:hypothetical protein
MLIVSIMAVGYTDYFYTSELAWIVWVSQLEVPFTDCEGDVRGWAAA